MIVTVGNTKGGVGKTTIAVNIAIARRLTGRDIWLIDADRQGTAQMAIRMRTEAGEHKDLCVVHAAALRHCECRYQQAFRQKAADAMEQARHSFAFAGIEPLIEPYDQPFRAGSPKYTTALDIQFPQGRCVNDTQILMLSYMRVRMILNIGAFFFNDTATTEIYTLSLHDALPI